MEIMELVQVQAIAVRALQKIQSIQENPIYSSCRGGNHRTNKNTGNCSLFAEIKESTSQKTQKIKMRGDLLALRYLHYRITML